LEVREECSYVFTGSIYLAAVEGTTVVRTECELVSGRLSPGPGPETKTSTRCVGNRILLKF